MPLRISPKVRPLLNLLPVSRVCWIAAFETMTIFYSADCRACSATVGLRACESFEMWRQRLPFHVLFPVRRGVRTDFFSLSTHHVDELFALIRRKRTGNDLGLEPAAEVISVGSALGFHRDLLDG